MNTIKKFVITVSVILTMIVLALTFKFNLSQSNFDQITLGQNIKEIAKVWGNPDIKKNNEDNIIETRRFFYL